MGLPSPGMTRCTSHVSVPEHGPLPGGRSQHPVRERPGCPPRELHQLLQRLRIPDPHLPVGAGRGEPGTVRSHRQTPHQTRMRQRAHRLVPGRPAQPAPFQPAQVGFPRLGTVRRQQRPGASGIPLLQRRPGRQNIGGVGRAPGGQGLGFGPDGGALGHRPGGSLPQGHRRGEHRGHHQRGGEERPRHKDHPVPLHGLAQPVGPRRRPRLDRLVVERPLDVLRQGADRFVAAAYPVLLEAPENDPVEVALQLVRNRGTSQRRRSPCASARPRRRFRDGRREPSAACRAGCAARLPARP